MKELTHKGLLNITAAAAANVDTDSSTLITMIVADNTADPLVPVINYPIKSGTIKKVTKVLTAAEVRRMWQIGINNDETPVVSTRYTINIDHVESKVFSDGRATQKPFSYTTPIATLGSAALDRSNLYTILAGKINAYAQNYMTAYTVQKVAYTGGTSVGDVTEAIVIGETGTQETSGATVKIVKITITSGTMAGDNAAGFIWVYGLATAAWLATSKTLTMGTSALVVTTAAALTVGAGLIMEDDAGYHITPTEKRNGASIVSISSTFLVSTALIHRDKVYSQGVGTEMLLHTPVYQKSKENLLSGDMDYTFLNAPVAGNTYTLLIVDIHVNSENVAGFGHANTQKVQLQLFCEDTTTANVDALQAALVALI